MAARWQFGERQQERLSTQRWAGVFAFVRMGWMGMAKFHEAFKGGHGKPACATIDVTPTWWPRRKRTCYAPVAAVVCKFPFATDFTIGLRGVSIESLLVKNPPQLLGEEIEKLFAALEEMGSEWSDPPLVIEQDLTIGSYATDELTVG